MVKDLLIEYHLIRALVAQVCTEVRMISKKRIYLNDHFRLHEDRYIAD
jgi:hypothetical protein